MAECLFGNKVDKSICPVDVSQPLLVLVRRTHEWRGPCVSMICCDVTNHTKTLGLKTMIAFCVLISHDSVDCIAPVLRGGISLWQ